MKRKSITWYITAMLVTAAAVLSGGSVYSSPYRLSPYTDGILAGSGLLLYGTAVYTERNTDPLTDSDIASLSEKDINRFDRSAAGNWSQSAAGWSDITVTAIMITPLAFLAEDDTRRDFFTIGAMYAESLLITGGLCGTVKNIVQRNRPYTYNPDAPYPKKKERDAVLSFYSGHTANAFNSAVFAGTVFSDYYPESSWRYAVWGTVLSAASLTGYLRYRAGMHYPSDIIAGAAAGSMTGWMVPALHRSGSGNISIQVITGEENLAAVILYF